MTIEPKGPRRAGQQVKHVRTGKIGVTTSATDSRSKIGTQFVGDSYPVRVDPEDLVLIDSIDEPTDEEQAVALAVARLLKFDTLTIEGELEVYDATLSEAGDIYDDLNPGEPFRIMSGRHHGSTKVWEWTKDGFQEHASESPDPDPNEQMIALAVERLSAEIERQAQNSRGGHFIRDGVSVDTDASLYLPELVAAVLNTQAAR